jgi:hypothetical protein
MKKQFLFLSSIVALTLFSCAKEKINPASNPAGGSGFTNPNFQMRTLPTLDEDGVGEWHNEYLSEVYDQLVTDIGTIGYTNVVLNDIKNSTEVPLIAHIKGNDSTYHRNNAKGIRNTMMDGDAIATNLSTIRTNINNTGLNSTLRSQLTAFWAKCDTVTTQSGANSICSTLKTWCNSNQTGVNKLIGIGTADLFQDSFEYWDANIDDWNTLLTDGGGGDGSQSMKASLAGADAAGLLMELGLVGQGER